MQMWAVARKDLRLELRSRQRLVGMLTFAVLVAVVFSFALDPTVRARSIAGAMIWVTILFAGTVGLGRSFAVEQEQDAWTGLALAPVDGGVLFLGKVTANLTILLVLELVVFSVYAVFFGLPLGGAWVGLATVAFLGTVGFVALGTLFAAIAAHTHLGESTLPVLLLPLLLPVVIFAAGATQRLLLGRPLAEASGSVKMLLAFDLIFLVVCTLAFGAVLEE